MSFNSTSVKYEITEVFLIFPISAINSVGVSFAKSKIFFASLVSSSCSFILFLSVRACKRKHKTLLCSNFANLESSSLTLSNSKVVLLFNVISIALILLQKSGIAK